MGILLRNSQIIDLTTTDTVQPEVQSVKAATIETTDSTMSWLKLLAVLFKLRIVPLLLFAAVGGAFLGAGRWPGTGRLVLLLVTGGLAAAGASALNEYLEKETDNLMVRTRHRPLVTSTIAKSGWVPYVASLMILLPSLAVLPFNPALTFFLLLGAIIYVGIYTIWLKPRTLLNIVIGGAAGSAAVLSGSAAVEAWNEPGAVVLALLLFLWTPTHFWSLALAYHDDYARSAVSDAAHPGFPAPLSLLGSITHRGHGPGCLDVSHPPGPWLALSDSCKCRYC